MIAYFFYLYRCDVISRASKVSNIQTELIHSFSIFEDDEKKVEYLIIRSHNYLEIVPCSNSNILFYLQVIPGCGGW